MMITQYQIIGLLKQEFLSDFTRRNLELKHFRTARKCFALAEKIYVEGDIMVQLLIERVFIDSLILVEAVKGKNRFEVLIPPILHEI